MSPLEFYEALARVADQVSLARVGMGHLSLSWEDRKGQPLHYKLESLLHHLYHTLFPHEL